MSAFLYTVYAAWSLRPHCRAGAHVLACRVASRLGVGPECDFPKPP